MSEFFMLLLLISSKAVFISAETDSTASEDVSNAVISKKSTHQHADQLEIAKTSKNLRQNNSYPHPDGNNRNPEINTETATIVDNLKVVTVPLDVSEDYFEMKMNQSTKPTEAILSKTENQERIFESDGYSMRTAEDSTEDRDVEEVTEKKSLKIKDVTTRKRFDPVDKEITQVLRALPKLPELTFPDNKSHFVFHKDPEEEALDERITQVARQLAEISLRHEFEEKKLGHYIPIRLRHFDESYQPQQRKKIVEKSYKPDLEFFSKMPQPPAIAFKPITIPQRIYQRRFYFHQQPPLESEMMSDPTDQTYEIFSEENIKSDENIPPSITTDIPTIFQLGSRYIIPTKRSLIPLVFKYPTHKRMSYAIF